MTENIDFWLPCQSKDGMRCHDCLCQSACLSVCHIPIQLCSKQLALFRPRYFSLIFDKTFDALKRASNNKLSSPGGETICPPPMALRSNNRGGSTSVRGRVRSPHISGGRRWLSCRQPACIQPRQLRNRTGRWTERQTDGIAPFQNVPYTEGA